MKDKTRTIKIRTWYGLNAVAEIEPAHWHRAGFGRFLIPHPPLVNWLLRRGLSVQAYRHLSVWHEIGHLQMFPLEILYGTILLGISIINGHTHPVEVMLVLMSCFAIWEIFAESYAINRKANCYFAHYKGVSFIPRILFWLTMLTLVISGWVVALT